jgi:hypothetical protein
LNDVLTSKPRRKLFLNEYVKGWGTFKELEASAAKGCDICRLLRLELMCESPSYEDLLSTTSEVEVISKKWQLDGSIVLNNHDFEVHCGNIRGALLNPQSWLARKFLALADGPGHQEDIPEFSGSLATDTKIDLRLAKRWLSDCVVNHPICGKEHRQFLPSRLIYVGSKSDIQQSETQKLVLSSNIIGDAPRYCTLSYCWGASATALKLTRDNLDRLTQNIPWVDLPKTIQDAIQVTRLIGIKYLWVDALCIIQPTADEQSDWLAECAQMKSIYQNTFCTISAAGAKDTSGGLFFELPWKRYPVRKCRLINRRSRLQIGLPLSLSPGFPPPHPSGPLFDRGWTLQEIALSPRILHWTIDGPVWQCRLAHVSEAYHDAFREYVRTTQDLISDMALAKCTSGEITQKWQGLVESFSPRRFTNYQDKLAAFSGIAAAFQPYMKSEYLAGLWRSRLESELLWVVRRYAKEGTEAAFATGGKRNHQAFIAPSWSWASLLSEEIDMRSLNTLPMKDRTWSVTVEDALTYVELASNDPTGPVLGGQIGLYAPMRNIVVDFHSAKTLKGRSDDYTFLNFDTSSPVGSANVFLDESDELTESQLTCVFLHQHQGTYRGLVLEPIDIDLLRFRRIGIAELHLYKGNIHYCNDDWRTITII